MTKSTVYIMVAAAPTAPPTHAQWMPPTSISTAPAPRISMAPERWGSNPTRPRHRHPG